MKQILFNVIFFFFFLLFFNKNICLELDTIQLPNKEIEFNEKNIKNPGYKEYFIKHLLTNIFNAKFIDTYGFLIDKILNIYPEFGILLANELIKINPYSLQNKDLEKTYNKLLNSLINSGNQETIQILVNKFLYDPELKQILHKLVSIAEYYQEKNPNQKKAIEIFVKTLNNMFTGFVTKMDLKTIDLVYPYLTQEKQKIISDYILKNQLTNFFPAPSIRNLLFFPQIVIDNHLDFIVDLIMDDKINISEYNRIIQQIREKLPENLYLKLIKAIIEKYGSEKNFTFAYAVKHPLKTAKLAKLTYFTSRLTKEIKSTQSKAQFFISLITSVEPLNLTQENIQFFLKIYAQEKIEESNGNYVFFHARNWLWNYYSDIYKQLWNITNNAHIGDNFQFLRFETPGKNFFGKDILWMNSAIFGNIRNLGSNTALYWLNNIDQSSLSEKHTIFTNQNLLSHFGLSKIYEKYANDFNELQKIHNKASKRGEFLLISLEPKALGNIVPLKGMLDNYDIKTYLDLLKTDPIKLIYPEKEMRPVDIDKTEWGLILGKWDESGNYIPNSFVTNPHSGLVIYSFYEADEKIMDEYFRLRDELFSKIKKDLSSQLTIRAKL